MHALANPARFVRLADRILPATLTLAVLLLLLGSYYGLIASPADYQQGDTVRIMYIHVPSAYIAVGAYVGLALCAVSTLVYRHPLGDAAGRAIAPVGLFVTGLALLTGSVWGKPMWGTFWVWDARLTSVLVLFFLYLGYIAILGAIEDRAKAARAASILALVGVINIPIIKFSVDWWTTLHQPASLFRMGGPTIDSSMLTPLLLMLAGISFWFVTVVLWRMKAEIADARLHALQERWGVK